ncbi:ankyrin repeat incomplete domain containing protein [Pandoravirus celtis]|uniref:Ankyrin repeat incomplete domain containing protein n=1 Tax=Pandoravirus celtis TaxID=2568002 RepID=A0A4D6EIX7_9VIRU|nr:ankyrin repeat incomplete domain containing protein [Pandoravirus celtis]
MQQSDAHRFAPRAHGSAPSDALPLPNELLAAVLAHLDPVDCVAASRVQRLWRVFVISRAVAFDAAYAAQLAARGHLKVLQWARADGCLCDESASTAAARRGHLHILQWLCDNGYPLSAVVPSAAARGGHLAVLQWLGDEQRLYDKRDHQRYRCRPLLSSYQVDACRSTRLLWRPVR